MVWQRLWPAVLLLVLLLGGCAISTGGPPVNSELGGLTRIARQNKGPMEKAPLAFFFLSNIVGILGQGW